VRQPGLRALCIALDDGLEDGRRQRSRPYLACTEAFVIPHALPWAMAWREGQAPAMSPGLAGAAAWWAARVAVGDIAADRARADVRDRPARANAGDEPLGPPRPGLATTQPVLR
jgi:hypothetical protein